MSTHLRKTQLLVGFQTFNGKKIVEIKRPTAKTGTPSFITNVQVGDDVASCKDRISVFADEKSCEGDFFFDSFKYPQNFDLYVVGSGTINISASGKAPAGIRNLIQVPGSDWKVHSSNERLIICIALTEDVVRTSGISAGGT